MDLSYIANEEKWTITFVLKIVLKYLYNGKKKVLDDLYYSE